MPSSAIRTFSIAAITLLTLLSPTAAQEPGRKPGAAAPPQSTAPAGDESARPEIPPEIEKMIQDGLSEALDARLRGGANPTEKHWLARAFATRARRARQADERRKAYVQAAERYRKWVESLERGG
ncbi:MAG: hypothetical protein AB1716_16805, partial [Planctomycetota bacterium]